MPWASQAQRKKFYATPSLHKYIPEFNAATPEGKKLPKRIKPKKKKKKRSYKQVTKDLAVLQ